MIRSFHLVVGETGVVAHGEAEGLVLQIVAAPMFEVMITIVLRKSTLRPWASVSFPSSRIWRRMLKTSGWAFSISSGYD